MKKLLTKNYIFNTNLNDIQTINMNDKNDKINYQTIINKLDFQIEKYKNNIYTYKNNIDILKNNFKCIVCFDDYIKFIPSCGHAGICKNCKNVFQTL